MPGTERPVGDQPENNCGFKPVGAFAGGLFLEERALSDILLTCASD